MQNQSSAGHFSYAPAGQPLHDVVVMGTTASTQDTAPVISRLSALTKISKEQAAVLLARPTVIKRDVDEPTALRYQAALHKIGVVCEIRAKETLQLDSPVTVEAPPPTPAAPRESPGAMIFCYGCGGRLHATAPACPQCGAPARDTSQFVMPPPATAPRVAVDNTAVWFLAFAPLIGWFLEGVVAYSVFHGNEYAAQIAWYSSRYWYVTVALNLALSYFDQSKLERQGIAASTSRGMAWLVPVYLFKRSKDLGQGPGYFATWIVCFSLTFLAQLGL